jgi:prepilin-type N-terminal cleavage/methylation domain-containing protein
LQPSNDRGFTIIEVLVAMVILTVALVSMAELMAITLRMQQLGRNQTTATRLAQDKIDELMSRNFTFAELAVGGSLTADVANHFDVPGTGAAVNTTQGNRQYTRRWLVEAMNFGDTVSVTTPPQGGNPAVVNNVVIGAGTTRRITVRVIPLRNDRRMSTPVDLVTIVRCWPC